MTQEIPQAVKEIADKNGLTHVKFVRKKDNLTIFVEDHPKPKDGQIPEPTGIPCCISYDGKIAAFHCGLDSLDLLYGD